MENDNILITFLSLVIIINIIVILLIFGLCNDLSNKVTKLEKINTELKQENTELKWELDQVDQMICTNEELEYEQN